MKLGAIVSSTALAITLASTALAITPRERDFLGPDGLNDRIATVGTADNQAAPVESWVTNQGGNSGKVCDMASIPANVMTQVSSDNAGNNGNAGVWQAGGSGFVTLVNSGLKPALCTADFFYGDQTTAGSDLGNYAHVTVITWKRIAPGTGEQINWQLMNLDPLNPAQDGDYMADFLFITCSQPVTCMTNGYQTVEHN